MGVVGRLKEAATTEIVCGELGGEPMRWRVKRVSDYQIASANHASVTVLPVKQLIRSARAAAGLKDEDSEDLTPAERIEAAIEKMRSDALQIGPHDLKRLKDAQTAVLCAAVVGVGVGDREIEPVTLVEEGESDDAAGQLCVNDLPAGVADQLSGEVYAWLTGGDKALARLKSFRAAPGAA